ncbi:unnamed protein product [Sphagnum compactum]
MACCGCLACVEQSTVGMVEKWGRFSYVAQPGLHCLNPFLGEWMAGSLSLRVQSLDVGCDTKTKHNLFVTVVCSIQYRVVRQNADDAFYELQDPPEQIQSYVFDDHDTKSPLVRLLVCFSNTFQIHALQRNGSSFVMDLVLVTQYFDTMKEIGNSSQNTTVFLPHGPGHVGDITSQIRNGLMQGSAAHTST